MRSPRPSPALVLVLALSIPACGPTTACPAGTSLVGGACVAPDASPNLPDGGSDANVDAPMPDAHVPCGGACTGTTPQCDVATDTCVGCLTNAHCTEADASVCSASHTCEGCGASTDCTHLTATPVCDAAAMTCVECLTNDDCAATEGCTPAHACVPFTPDSVATCGTCTRDAECHAGELCVPMTYDDPTTGAADPVPAGNHCLWREDASGAGAPNGSCFGNGRPYVRASSLTSVDGVTAMVCTLAVSTCEAQTAFRMTDCMTLDAAGDARCGEPTLHDGVCRMVDATHNRCTTFCVSDDDCPAGVTCNTGASPRVCNF
ncbi:MAG: hypothetical protein U0234_15190 [Sandaracinus sp.]